MLQSEFISTVADRPAQFAWLLGAGASRTAGLPTATDIIWDLKRRFYKLEENRDVSPQDIQVEAVRYRIQQFMEARGLPAMWADDEYTAYFEKIFGDDHDRQRRYLKAILSEDKVTLSVGNRVLGAMMVAGFSRAVFTTNFDSVLEKAVAEVGGASLQAYSLEGTAVALRAFQNEEFPFYCKLHGDFRYESLKNLSSDLATQNANLSAAFVASAGRFGLIVAGYSGRDASVMSLLLKALESPNPFPHGVFWTGMKGASVLPAVDAFLIKAKSKGVVAEHVEIETFDAMMSRLWRNLEDRPANLDAKVRKAQVATVNIPSAGEGKNRPLLRMNALPISLPDRCLELTLRNDIDWRGLRDRTASARPNVVATKGNSVLAWGLESDLRACFSNELIGVAEAPIATDFQSASNLHLKAFLEEALIGALVRDRPLLARMRPSAGYIIVDAHAEDVGALEPLQTAIGGRTSGQVGGLFSPVSDDHPVAQQVSWAEALRVSLDRRDNRTWLLIEPAVWIWPTHARSVASEFLDKRVGGRFNRQHNALLSAWIETLLGTNAKNTESAFQLLNSPAGPGNPTFQVGSRTAFARVAAA